MHTPDYLTIWVWVMGLVFHRRTDGLYLQRRRTDGWGLKKARLGQLCVCPGGRGGLKKARLGQLGAASAHRRMSELFILTALAYRRLHVLFLTCRYDASAHRRHLIASYTSFQMAQASLIRSSISAAVSRPLQRSQWWALYLCACNERCRGCVSSSRDR